MIAIKSAIRRFSLEASCVCSACSMLSCALIDGSLPLIDAVTIADGQSRDRAQGGAHGCEFTSNG